MDNELFEIYTGWFVSVLGLQLYTLFSSVCIHRMFESNLQLENFRTRPLVDPSCVLLPVTLNATLLGVLLLTSRAAELAW
jgi:hypothetical protein